MARRAAGIIDGQGAVGVPLVVLLESAHVLRTQYGVDRLDVLDAMIELVTRKNIEVLGVPGPVVIEALARARSIQGAPLPDALVAATARAFDALPLYSFDKEIGRHGVPVSEP